VDVGRCTPVGGPRWAGLPGSHRPTSTRRVGRTGRGGSPAGAAPGFADRATPARPGAANLWPVTPAGLTGAPVRLALRRLIDRRHWLLGAGVVDQGVLRGRWSMYPGGRSEMGWFARIASTNVNSPARPHWHPGAGQPPAGAASDSPTVPRRHPPGAANHRPVGRSTGSGWCPNPCVRLIDRRHRLRGAGVVVGLALRRQIDRRRRLPSQGSSIKDFGTDAGRCTPAGCPIWADFPGSHRPTSTRWLRRSGAANLRLAWRPTRQSCRTGPPLPRTASRRGARLASQRFDSAPGPRTPSGQPESPSEQLRR
jgi:hypothetical protein